MELKIVRLDIENVKRIEAVTVEPDGSVVIIGGENGAGKSTVLDCIMYALAGGRTIPTEPLRRGADKGKIVLDLDGITVKRTFTQGGGGSLRITTKDGMTPHKPQAWLDQRIASLSFDPLEFARDTRRQAEMLREIVGIDLSDIDGQIATLMSERRRDKDALKSQQARVDMMPYHQGVPEEPLSVADLVAELDKARQLHAAADVQAEEADAKDVEADELIDHAKGCEHIAGDEEDEIKRLKAQIKDLEASVKAERKTAKTDREQAAKKREEAEAIRIAAQQMPRPDLDAIQERIGSADETNRLVAENKRRVEAHDQAEDMVKGVEKQTRDLRAARKARTERLAACEFPVNGLSFDESGGVTFNDIPFDQVAQSERLRVAVGVAFATHSELPIALIRDGSLLDAQAMKMVAEMAEKAGAQLWIERVGTGDAGAVVIEDGHNQDAPAAAVSTD